MALFASGTSEWDKFPEPPVRPELSRESCLSPSGLRAFLRLSRANTDDVLKQRINALLRDDTQSKETICHGLSQDFLMASWKQRLETIEYCGRFSEELLKDVQSNEDQDLKDKLVDLRVNPYAQIDFDELKEQKFAQVDALKAWVSNERTIEDIVQSRSTAIMNERCGELSGWKAKFQQWSTSIQK